MPSIKRRERLEEAIKSLVARGVYPSCSKISRELGRSGANLSGPEVKLRKELFDKLGIKIVQKGVHH